MVGTGSELLVVRVWQTVRTETLLLCHIGSSTQCGSRLRPPALLAAAVQLVCQALSWLLNFTQCDAYSKIEIEAPLISKQVTLCLIYMNCRQTLSFT
jgi:hypothetical protein